MRCNSKRTIVYRCRKKEPYIDENGDYKLGNIAYYELNGKKYAINDDGSLGDELSDDDIVLSYFDFTPINNATEYQINYYTGPTDELSVLVIPKTYQGKPVTVLGSSAQDTLINYEGKTKTQFELTLTDNIREIKKYTFYTIWVTKVKGNTSNLNKLGDYAFSWANSPSGYTLDFKLDYNGTITAGSEIFNHMNITLRLKHSTKFNTSSFGAQKVTYDFKDAHIYGQPKWTWTDDYSTAAAEFTCTDSRCKHEETVEATVTKTYSNGSPKYTVSLTFEDETYTDTKSFDNPLDGDYTDPITAASARANDNNLFSLPDGYVYKKASLLGVQKKDNVNSETGLTSMRFVAEISSEYLDADDYGFEIVKTSKDTTKAFSDANGFNIMQNLLDSGSKNIKTFTRKGTINKVSGNPIYGDNDSTSTEYKYVTLAVNDIPDTQGIAVRFYVVKDGVKYYSTYTNSEDTFRGCCASCSQLIKTASPDEA